MDNLIATLHIYLLEVIVLLLTIVVKVELNRTSVYLQLSSDCCQLLRKFIACWKYCLYWMFPISMEIKLLIFLIIDWHHNFWQTILIFFIVIKVEKKYIEKYIVDFYCLLFFLGWFLIPVKSITTCCTWLFCFAE